MIFYIYKSWERVDNQPAFEVTKQRRGDQESDTSIATFDCDDESLAAAYAALVLENTDVETRNSVIILTD